MKIKLSSWHTGKQKITASIVESEKMASSGLTEKQLQLSVEVWGLLCHHLKMFSKFKSLTINIIFYTEDKGLSFYQIRLYFMQ